MSSATLLDSSVFIPYLRNGTYAATVDALLARGRVVLHTVVVLELYAGTASVEDKRDVDELRAAAERLGRVVHPSADDLALAGQVLADYSRSHGRIRPRDHTHDLLIAIGAGRGRHVLLTENVSDMQRWAEALTRRARLTVRVERPPE